MINRFKLSVVTAAVLAAAALTPATANANPHTIIRDCESHSDGYLHGKYSISDLNKALSVLPTDIDEYTDCRDTIQRAINAQSARSQPGSRGQSHTVSPSFPTLPAPPPPGPPSTPPPLNTPLNPHEWEQYDRAVRPPPANDHAIAPNSIPHHKPKQKHRIPGAILVPLSLMTSLVLSGGGWFMSRRVFFK